VEFFLHRPHIIVGVDRSGESHACHDNEKHNSISHTLLIRTPVAACSCAPNVVAIWSTAFRVLIEIQGGIVSLDQSAERLINGQSFGVLSR
jgi:hypothetical protein